VLIDQSQVLVERYLRQGDDWVFSALDDFDATLQLVSINCSLPLRDIYARVSFSDVQMEKV
jgi:hypothetical protein